jgi:diguanylate cyclase (GGDEF)-like protein
MLRLGMDTLDMDVAILSEKVNQHFVLAHLVDTLGMFKVDEICPLEAICNQAGVEDKSLFISDLSADSRPALQEVAGKYGIHAYVGSPIWVGEQFYGTLAFLRQKPLQGGFPRDDVVFIELLAAWFSQMLLQNKQRQRLEQQALADELTGLPNRRAAEQRFGEEIARARRDGVGFSIATCDLDRFKLINDHYGHVIGDEVLQQVAHVMRQALREGDWVARWGGEEFILFLHHSDQIDAFAAAERIREAIKAAPIKTSQGEVEVTASFGVGVFRPDDTDIAHALSESDSCLYEAKRRGRDCVVVGKETGGQGTLWRAGLLQRALKEDRVVAAYQIMVDLKTGRPVADEALARLVMPDGSVLAAGEFIEAAEGVNLIHEVDHVITTHAMSRCAVNLLGGHDPGFAHFINLSPQFLARKEFVDELLASAQKFCSTCDVRFPGFKPAVFEITERQLLSDFDKLRADLQPLLDFGFRLALDDFGSGYSSFLYLAELPVSFLKIEGWMVRNMRNNERVLHMVESMILLSRKMNITTIAECIEDAETAEMLRDIILAARKYKFSQALEMCRFSHILKMQAWSWQMFEKSSKVA